MSRLTVPVLLPVAPCSPVQVAGNPNARSTLARAASAMRTRPVSSTTALGAKRPAGRTVPPVLTYHSRTQHLSAVTVHVQCSAY